MFVVCWLQEPITVIIYPRVFAFVVVVVVFLVSFIISHLFCINVYVHWYIVQLYIPTSIQHTTFMRKNRSASFFPNHYCLFCCKCVLWASKLTQNRNISNTNWTCVSMPNIVYCWIIWWFVLMIYKNFISFCHISFNFSPFEHSNIHTIFGFRFLAKSVSDLEHSNPFLYIWIIMIECCAVLCSVCQTSKIR